MTSSFTILAAFPRTKLLAIMLYLGALLCSSVAHANSAELAAVKRTLNDYIEGTSYNRTAQINRAFHPSAWLYLEQRDQSQWHVPVKDYVALFEHRIHNQFNGRIGEILNIDIDGRIAIAKVAIILPKRSTTYIDQILLKKFAAGPYRGQWLIVAKSAVSFESNDTGKKILFIASSAPVHGDSDIPAGVSFSEIVNAWKTFTEAGFSVDFVSPDGGPLPLSYINYRDNLHVKHLYTPDFMYAIANSLKPDEVKPADYAAVHYLGGSNAMYGVAEDEAIQAISMEVYEKHGGIISAVCHGTAGIVNLKTQNGQYLVKNRRISGYPESFEKQDRPYFQHFPFLIQKTIEERGGKFKHSAANSAHVEVDGRIVTGQNHLSSEGVAKEIIRLLTSTETAVSP